MASKTSATWNKRRNKTTKMGKKRKRIMRNKGSTPTRKVLFGDK